MVSKIHQVALLILYKDFQILKKHEYNNVIDDSYRPEKMAAIGDTSFGMHELKTITSRDRV